MPFFTPLNFDDNEQKKDQSTQVSGASNVISGNSTNQGQSNPSNKNSSGSFANLNQYLDANKEQASQMGSTITNNVDQSAQDASNKVNQFKASAPIDVQKQTQENITGMLDNAATTDKNQYKALKTTGGYSGPDSYDQVNGYNDASQAYSKANNQVKNLATEEGRQNLLTDTYNRPNYSQGQKTFDNLLLQNDPSSKKMFENTASKWSGINSLLDNATSEVGNRINTGKQNALANKALVNATEQQYVNNFISPLEQRKNEYNLKNPEFLNRISSDINDKDGYYNQETIDALSKLGLKQNDEIYNLDLSKYFNPNFTEAQVNNVATNDERARWGALMNLLDSNDQRITQDGKNLNPYSLDTNKFATDLANAKAERAASDAALKSKEYTTQVTNYMGSDPLTVQFGDLQHFLDSGKTALDYIRDNGWNINSPKVQSVIAQMEADKAALNSHNLFKGKNNG